MKKNIIIALLSGLIFTLLAGFLVSTKHLYKSGGSAEGIIVDCEVAFPGPMTDVEYGFPLPINMTRENTCRTEGTGIKPLNIVINTVIYAMLAFVVISLARKKV